MSTKFVRGFCLVFILSGVTFLFISFFIIYLSPGRVLDFYLENYVIIFLTILFIISGGFFIALKLQKRTKKLNLQRYNKLAGEIREVIDNLSKKPENSSGIAKHKIQILESEFEALLDYNSGWRETSGKGISSLLNFKSAIDVFIEGSDKCISAFKRRIIKSY